MAADPPDPIVPPPPPPAPTPPAHPRRFIFFSDFDGTITRTDSNIVLVDTHGCGRESRLAREALIVSGDASFRDVWAGLLGSAAANLGIAATCEFLLANIELDPGFGTFYDWCRRSSSSAGVGAAAGGGGGGERGTSVDVVVLSGGMGVVIEKLLDGMLGEEKRREIRVVSNEAGQVDGKGGIDEAGGWEIAWKDDTPFGHDKSVEIRKFSQLPGPRRPVMFYAGDGISDYSAARETDLLFAKAGEALVTYCDAAQIPHIPFEDFGVIHEVVQGVVGGRFTIQDALENYGKTYD